MATLSGSLLDTKLNPVTGAYDPNKSYRLQLSALGGDRAKTVAVKVFKEPSYEGASLVGRLILWFCQAMDRIYYKKVLIQLREGDAPVPLLVCIRSVQKRLGKFSIGNDNLEQVFSSENAFAKKIKFSKLEKATGDAFDETRLSNLIDHVISHRSEWEGGRKDVRIELREGFIHYDAATRKVNFTLFSASRAIRIDYDTCEVKKHPLSSYLPLNDIQDIERYLAGNFDRLYAIANEERNEDHCVYVKPSEAEGVALPRALEVHANGAVIVQINSEKKGDKLLGRGSFKTAKKAVDHKTGEVTASISTWTPIDIATAERKLSGLTHSIQYKGVSYSGREYTDTATGKVFRKQRFRMTYCNQGDLKGFIFKKGPKLLAMKRSLAEKAVDALLEAHRKGYIHRDIKPENFLVHYTKEAGYQVFLADHDMMCHASSKEDAEERARGCGTPFYMAPEFLRAVTEKKSTQKRKIQRATTHKRDVFALGLTLYQLLTQKAFPFEGKRLNLFDLRVEMLKFSSEYYEKHREENSVEGVIARMLSPLPECRITLEQAQEQLAALP